MNPSWSVQEFLLGTSDVTSNLKKKKILDDLYLCWSPFLHFLFAPFIDLQPI